MLITASLTQSDISSFLSEVSIKISDSSITEDLMETPSTKIVLTSTLVLTEVVLITSLRYQLTSFESSTVRTEVSTVANLVQISATSIFSKVVSNSTETSSIVTPAQLFDSSTMFITASLTPSEISSFSYEYSLFISDPSVVNTMMETPTVRLVSTSVSESTEVALLTSPRYRLTSIKSATITTEVSKVASSVQISATSIFSKVISNNTETSSIFTPIQLHDSSTMFIGASLTRSGLSSFLDEFPIKTSDSSNTETMMDTPTKLLVLTSTSVITEVASTTSPKYPSTLFETSTKSTEVSTVASSVQISATSIFSKVVLNSTETSSIVTPAQLLDSSTMFITASLTPSELSSFSYEYSIFIFDPSATNTMMETPTVRLVSTSVTESTEVALITSPRYRLTSIESSTITTDVSTVANSVQISAKSIFSKVVSNSTETLSIFTPIQLHDSSTMFIGASLTRSGLSSFLDEFPIKTSDSSNTETMMDTPTTLLVLTSTSVITEVALTTSPKYPSTLFETVTKSNEVSTLASSVQIPAISTFSTVVSNSTETSSIVTPTQLHDSSTIFITASLTPSEISTFSHEFSIFTSAPITNKTDALVLVTSTLATEYSSKTYETETEVLTDSFKVLHTFPVTLISTNVAIITTTAALSATTIPLTLSSSTILTTASATTSNEFLFTSLKASTSAESELTTLITASTVFTTTVATTTNVSRIISSTSFEIVIPAYLTNNKEIKLFYIILVKLISGSTLAKRRHPSSYTWEEIGNHTDGLYLVGILEATSKITKFIVGKGSSRKRRDTNLVPDNPPLESETSYSTFVIGVKLDNTTETSLYSDIVVTLPITIESTTNKTSESPTTTTQSPTTTTQSPTTTTQSPTTTTQNTTTTTQNPTTTIQSPTTTTQSPTTTTQSPTTTTQSPTTTTQSPTTTTQSPTTTTQNPTITSQPLLKCNKTTIGDKNYKGVYIFDQALINNVTTLNCTYSISLKFQNKCILKSSNTAEWEYDDPPDCPPKSEASKQLLNLTKIQVTESNAEETAKSLSEIVQVKNLTTSYEINLISDVIENIINVSSSRKVTEKILSAIDVVLSLDKSMIEIANEKFNSSTALLSHLDDLGKQQKENISIPMKNLALASYSIKINQNPIYIYSTQANNANVNISNVDPRNPTKVFKAFIELPSDLFNGRNESQIYSYLFLEKKFFENLTVIDSVVLSVTVNGKAVNNTNIFMMFLRDSNDTGSRTCRYYKTIEKIWSTNGCNTTNNLSSVVSCTCNHLTNFALILDVDQSGYNSLSLRIMSWIGCGISIAGLFITILSYVLFRKLRMSLASQILINLCISLMITLILFLSLVEHTQPRALCQTVASLIQFFLLSTFFWMVVEAANLYQMFVKVFRGAYRTRLFMIQSYAFAWGIPMLFTVVTAVIKPDNLGPATDRDPKICVLRGISFYCGLLLPVCVVMLTNFVLLILVLRGINAKSKAAKSMEIQKKARIAFGCTLLLGTTWVFAVLAVGNLRDVFQWLFCIFNSLQGFFIFIFYAVRNKEVRNHWRLFLGKENGRRGSNQYTSRNRTQRTTSSHSRSDSGSSHGTRQF